LGNGPNRVLEELAEGSLTEVRPVETWQEELKDLLSPLTRTVIQMARTPMDSLIGKGEGKETSQHLIKLYAHQEIQACLAEKKEPARLVAVDLASTFRLGE
jgi:hypothetical protein